MNAYGCDNWLYSYGRAYGETQIHKRDHSNCNHPHAAGWVAIGFCVLFCVVGAQVLLTLFIGIIATAMEESKAEQDKKKGEEERIVTIGKLLGIDPSLTAGLYVEVFDNLDTKGEGKVTREAIKRLVECLPGVRKVYTKSHFSRKGFRKVQT